MNANTIWIIGMIASVLTAVGAVSSNMPEPYKTIFALLGVIGTAISGYLAQPRRRNWTEEEREAKTGIIKRPDDSDDPPKAA